MKSRAYRIPFVEACLADLSGGSARDWFRQLDEVTDGVVADQAESVDRTAGYPAASVAALQSIGAFGVQVPQRLGGLGMDDRAAALVVERVAQSCSATAAVLMFHYQVVRRTLSHGSTEKRDDDLAAFASGERVAVSAWTEAASGKGKRNLQTVLRPAGDEWTLSGEKTFCTGLPGAGLIHVLAKADLSDGSGGPTFVRIDAKDPGVTIPEVYPLLGLRGSGTGTVALEDVRLGEADLVGPVGAGGALMQENHRVCLNPGLLALGTATAAFETALAMCSGQLPGTTDRMGSEGVRRALAEALVQVESAYLYAARAVQGGDGAEAHVLTSKFKLVATAAAERVATSLMAAVGSRGFLASFPLERHFRDAQATSLMGPANDLITDRIIEHLSQD